VIEVQLFIPVADNAGAAFPDARHAHFEQELLNLFGGSSLLPGTVTGQWTASGVVYRDEMRVYLVSVPGILAAADSLRAAVTFAKSHYSQLNIYVRYLGVSEIL
jgi:hypothetical protein